MNYPKHKQILLNSKERVLTSLQHKSPDRIPCSYVSTPEINQRLMNHFATESLDTVLECLGIDTRVIDAPYIGPDLRTWPNGQFENFWGHIRKPVHNQAGTYFESADLPYAAFKSISEVQNFRWPKPEWFDYSQIVFQCEKYKDYATVFGNPGNMDLINGTAYGRGVEQVMYDIALQDPIGLACMEKRFECCYGRSEQALKVAGGKIDILWIGDDYGSQNGLLISPNIWRKLFFPKLKAMCDLGHKHQAKVMLHSCGATKAIWPDLIEAGVDLYDTVQPEATDMDPAQLKKDFGEKICFHGTISTQKTLPFGSVDDVKAEVIKRIKTVGSNGGFIIAPAHNFQPDTPIENILALYNTATNSFS